MLDPAVHSGFEAAAVEAGKVAGYFVGQDGVVSGFDEEFGDAPDVFFRCHPVLAVETGEVDGDGVGAEGAFAAQVEATLKVAERELARSAINGRAEAQAGKVGLGDASPQAALAVEGDDMVVVVHGFEIHEQRRVAVETQGGSGDERALHAVAFAFAQHAMRRHGRVCVLVLQSVNELLDLRWSLEGAEGAHVGGREAKGFAARTADSVFRRVLALEGQCGGSLGKSLGRSRELYRRGF